MIMDFLVLEDFLKGEPNYRFKQVKEALYGDLIENWNEATVLPLPLRKNLEKNFPLSVEAETFVSKDKRTTRALIELRDGLKVEAVLMQHKDKRNTVCVSSQIGCPLGCLFCATGKMGFKRNLSASEIVEQVLFFARRLKRNKETITNIVFMGMGEPFLNYDNVLAAVKALNDKGGFNLGARRFSISTVGIVEGIEELAKEKLETNLAISLHAPDDILRSKIIPCNEKYPIKNIIEAVDRYIEATNRKVMFEYIMIEDLNDSPEHAEKLAGLMKKSLYFVNLISYNSTGVFKPSSDSKMKEFRKILEDKGVSVTQRYKFGDQIKAACGQLAANKQL